MVENALERTRRGSGFAVLHTWGQRVERLIFSKDERHWTNSFVLWISLNFMDAAITWYSLSLGAYEVGPFLRFAAQTHGDIWMLLIKMALALLFGILVWSKGSRRLKGILNTGMSLVVIVNCVFVCRMIWWLELYG